MTQDLPGADALAEFSNGFDDGITGRPRAKGRSGAYRRAYARGVEAALRDAEFRAGPLELPGQGARRPIARRRG